ncbi:hypothetical protein ACFYRK_31745 [Streptomyces sp. NPDC005381]|uniref:hypothetical protein n=1 Tax=Streptomyces sp. NPDC005381 TaxID=3364714 RepID=UPI0036C37978
MSRGEETDEPNTGGDPAVPGKPMDLGKPDTVGEASEPAPRFAVVISGDGSAAIDGEPVPASAGTTVDAAILDVLHGYARDLNTTVTATISDPSAGYVAFVEVAPDGSSSLLDQQEQQEPQQEPTPPPAPVPLPVPAPEHTGPPPAEAEPADGTEDFAEERAAEGDGHSAYAEDADDDYDDDPYDGDAAGAYEDDDEEDHDAEAAEADDDDDDGYDVEAYALEQQRLREAAPLPPPPPAPNAPSSSYASAPSYADDDADADDEDDEVADFGADSGREEGFPVAGAAAARPAPQLVRRPGSRQSDDEYRGPGLLHRPMVVGPVGLVVAALVIVPLVILGSGGSDDGGHRKEAARSSEETSKSPQAGKPGPISTSSPSLPPPPSVSASPSPKPKKSKDAKKETKKPGGGGGVVVTITARPPQATVTAKPAKPAQDTAASAVKRLARNDPSGRHICYRAYVSGQGWQKPVCDGTMAGTTNQNRPIKALNIAVSGSGGSSANAFVHNSASKDGRGKWMPQWTPVRADGANNYIGSTKKGAPNMSGFAINVGTGRVCQLAKVHSFDWGGQGCADARPGYIFGGALENDRYLEAVKFTV